MSDTGWIVLATALTAAFTFGILIVAWLSHVHDRSLSGVGRPIFVRRVRSNWSRGGDDGAWPMPEGADREYAFGVAVRLVNVSSQQRQISLLRARPLLRPSAEPNDMVWNVPPSGNPRTALIVVLGKKPWRCRRHRLMTLAFETAEGVVVKRRRWMRVFPLAEKCS